MNAKSLFFPLVLAALAFAAAAWAKICAVTITGTDQMSFDQSQMKVAADCTEVALTLKHSSKLTAAVMGHNWVLTKTPDFQGVPMPAPVPAWPTTLCPRAMRGSSRIPRWSVPGSRTRSGSPPPG